MRRENNIKSNTFKYSHVLVLHRIKKEIWKRIIKLSNLAETQILIMTSLVISSIESWARRHQTTCPHANHCSSWQQSHFDNTNLWLYVYFKCQAIRTFDRFSLRLFFFTFLFPHPLISRCRQNSLIKIWHGRHYGLDLSQSACLAQSCPCCSSPTEEAGSCRGSLMLFRLCDCITLWPAAVTLPALWSYVQKHSLLQNNTSCKLTTIKSSEN